MPDQQPKVTNAMDAPQSSMRPAPVRIGGTCDLRPRFAGTDRQWRSTTTFGVERGPGARCVTNSRW